MTRARTDTAVIAHDVINDLSILRGHILSTGNEKVKEAFATIETHVAISLRVFAKTNPSKIRDVARSVEIAFLMRELEEGKKATSL